MNSDEYTKLVESENYPDDPEVIIDHSFKNDNGEIINLLLQNFTSVALIHSKQGSVRANHYHKTDWHYAYILEGEINYFWRKKNTTNELNSRVFKKNKMFFTPPLVEHAMFFPVQTSFITFAKNRRDHQNHENDLVRFKIIDSKYNSEKQIFEPIKVTN
jgi:dTDP-4-dehydrorhamnose 3,5-epimerase-like enzyme|tara:strand:+ start:21 stop:497 length:477 start_codon:yes stop_codon:yes gene_type:complete